MFRAGSCRLPSELHIVQQGDGYQAGRGNETEHAHLLEPPGLIRVVANAYLREPNLQRAGHSHGQTRVWCCRR